MSESVTALILAAGKGTRMISDLPKGLHQVGGVPMVGHVGQALLGAGISAPIVVIGHGGDKIREALGDEEYRYVWQTEQLGTGHAARMAEPLLRSFEGDVIIAPGDAPLVTTEVFAKLLADHRASDADCTVASTILANPTGYGRVVRNGDEVLRIVEQKDATEEERAINEVAVSIFCFRSAALVKSLAELRPMNAQGEFYLTDTVEIIRAQGGTIAGSIIEDDTLVMGVNDRWQLAEAERVLRYRTLKRHALAGVTIRDPGTTYIGVNVRIAPNVVIEPNTTISGNTTIGEGSHIGPGTVIGNATILEETRIIMSQVYGATIGCRVHIGPFANIRPEAIIGDEAKIGNFVEIKKSLIHRDVKISHLTYIGDATIGESTNVGAGTITCNYDGFNKHQTTIGANAFVGSHSTLVAPVTIGDGAIVAAGSVITDNVPEDALGIGRGRQEIKTGWAAEWRRRKRSRT